MASANEKGGQKQTAVHESMGHSLNPITSVAAGEVTDKFTAVQGHSPVLRKNFSTLASLGLGFSITNSWIGYAASFGPNVVFAGPQSAIFGLLVAAVIQFFITLGLSEVASAFPSSGGQYHAVWLIASEKTKRFAAYIVGWCPSLAAIPISLAHKFEHTVTQFGLGCSILGAAITFIVLLSMKGETRSASEVFGHSAGTSGWNHDTAWVLGICNSLYALVATDAAIHVAEEMLAPSSQIPFILNTTILIGFVTTFPLIIVMMFTITDLDAVLSWPLPSLEVYYQATGSAAAATALQLILTICLFTAIFAEWITCSRMVWSFARDNGTPFPQFFAHVDAKKKIPVRAMYVSMGFCALYGLLYFASSTAFNPIVTSSIICLNLTYVVPQAILLFRGRTLLPTRALSLGPFGYFVNGFSLFVVVIVSILLCFPIGIPVATDSMNYTSAVLAGLFIIVLGLWFTIGKNFSGPAVDADNMESLAAQVYTGKRKFLGITWKTMKAA
ncbi:hypothetical protein PMZ80_003103 [Knufia obscura]|uniref:Uncharacterized protein n=1 Tax=Knufia obscura TaxID=1635080 RepID=A0ABR0RTT8_9EURO|nr:hypothetical protein PMZ80_003103 [Knufia obscura]